MHTPSPTHTPGPWRTFQDVIIGSNYTICSSGHITSTDRLKMDQARAAIAKATQAK